MRYTFLASFAVTVLATTAFAQGGGMGMMRADTNGDGMISRAEDMAQANAHFDRMDTNKDGTLTADERQGPGGRMMARAGAGDEAMTRAEFMAQADRRFSRIDTNKDEQLSPAELDVWQNRDRAMAGQRRADPADAIAPAAPAPAPNPGQ